MLQNTDIDVEKEEKNFLEKNFREKRSGPEKLMCTLTQ